MKILIDFKPCDEALERLKKIPGVEIAQTTPPEERARELPPELIADVEVLFCMFPPANHRAMQTLRWIQIASVGCGQLAGQDLPARGIISTNARGCSEVPIGEWNISMMINLARNLPQMLRNQQSRLWDRSAQFQVEIRGSTVGLWGYGGIGRETARLAKQLGMRVHVFEPSGVHPRHDVYTVPGTGDPDGRLPDKVFRAGQEMDFLRELDFLILGLPLSRETEGIIGEPELRALPPRAFVLNPARGPLIKQEALLKALREGWIAGAALDTHYQYPMPPEHPLWAFENVIFTPHISGSSLNAHFVERIWEVFVKNLELYRQNKPLLNTLTERELAG
jgi:phosphoglycerate dehydrogenase-like enzyme